MTTRQANTARAVSYTHLDVYKRQALYHFLAGDIERAYAVLNDETRRAITRDIRPATFKDPLVLDMLYVLSLIHIYVTLLQGLGFFGPMLAGALSDAFGLQLALVYMQLVFVIGGLIMLVAGFTYVKDYNRARAMEA